MMGFDLILLVIIGAVAYAIGWRPRLGQSGPAPNSRTPLEVLKERFARGEIGREEYEERRHVLEG